LATLEAQLGQLETQSHLRLKATEALDGDKNASAFVGDTGNREDDHEDNQRESDGYNGDHDGDADQENHTRHDDDEDHEDSD